MTDDDKKLLTEFLGECWHEIEQGAGGVFSCIKCGYTPDEITKNYNRSFTTWQDLGDLRNKLLEKGKWSSFIIFSCRAHLLERNKLHPADIIADLAFWLFNPPIFIPLVAEFLKQEATARPMITRGYRLSFVGMITKN